MAAEARAARRALVTGAAGLLGSNLVDALLGRGYQVVGVDDLSTGSLVNLASAHKSGAFSLRVGDVREIEALCADLRDLDVVVHLAGRKIPRYGGALDTLLVNGEGGHACIRLALARGTGFALASTSDVDGKSPAVPFREDHDSLFGPSRVRRWDYAISKLYEERLCYAYAEAHGLRFTIARIFGSYGPRQHRSWWGGLQSVFIEAALRGEPMEIHGDGQQTRSFTYVSDTVAGLLAAVEGAGEVGDVVHVGSTEEISIENLARLVYRLCGGRGEPPLRLVPYESFGRSYEDVRRRVPDASLARERLGFAAQVPLVEGLKRTIAWQRQVAGRER